MDRERGNSVYLLVRDDIPKELATVASTSDSSFLWHCCLGHPSHRRLQQAIPWVPVESFVCESCQLGKHHRATYKRQSLSISQSPFDLVHCNILKSYPCFIYFRI